MELSVHIVTCGRLELLKDCCASVATALPPEAEVVVILNGDCPGVVRYLLEWGHPQFRWVQVPRESLSRSRNRAFEICRGDVVYYLDDDVKVPNHLFQAALNHFSADPGLAVLGGPNLTPPDSPWIEKLFGAVMTSMVAAPMVRTRYSPASPRKTQKASQHNLIFCNLAIRARLVPPELRFKEDLVSNQENLFLHLLRNLGIKAVLVPELYVYHRRRKTVGSFAHQVASYGCGRLQQTCASWKSCHPLYLAPPLSLLLMVVLLFYQKMEWIFLFFIAYCFFALSGALHAKSIRQLGWRGVLLAVPLTAVVHSAYGFGWWRGLYAKLCPKYFLREGLLFGHWQNSPG